VGIYDRDYYRQERAGSSIFAGRSVVVSLIVVNVAIWLVDGFFMPDTPDGGRWLSEHMAVHVGTLKQPWLWWQYLTAGFAHAPQIGHILTNMLALFFLGPDVENTYGQKEFLRLYLAMVVFTAVVWDVINTLGDAGANMAAYGASGAITGVVILFALNFPRRTLLLFFVIPVPAWLVGVLLVLGNMFGLGGGEQNAHIAYSMHLAGAAFAAAYYKFGWNFGRLFGEISWPKFGRKPRLRIHDPSNDPDEPTDLSAEVDRILAKIYREGEASLSPKERQTLERASRAYQKKVRGDGRP
jgi:membrane associated rhomboid family serine protease